MSSDPRFVPTVEEWGKIARESNTEKVCNYCCLKLPISICKRELVEGQWCTTGGGIMSFSCYDCNKTLPSDKVLCCRPTCNNQKEYLADDCFPVVDVNEIDLGRNGYGPHQKTTVKWACKSCHDRFYRTIYGSYDDNDNEDSIDNSEDDEDSDGETRKTPDIESPRVDRKNASEY